MGRERPLRNRPKADVGIKFRDQAFGSGCDKSSIPSADGVRDQRATGLLHRECRPQDGVLPKNCRPSPKRLSSDRNNDRSRIRPKLPRSAEPLRCQKRRPGGPYVSASSCGVVSMWYRTPKHTDPTPRSPGVKYLNFKRFWWWAARGSNPRPSRCKRDALTS